MFLSLSRALFGLVLRLNKSECLNCKAMLITGVVAHLYAVTLKLSVGFTDFLGMQSLKCGNSSKSRPGLEDYCYCVYQHVIFLAVFYYIRYEPFFHFHCENN